MKGRLEFFKEDIEPLDFILNKVIKKSHVEANDLLDAGFIKNVSNELEFNVHYKPEFEFIRYWNIVKEYGVAECKTTKNGAYIRVNEKTLHFLKQSGLKKTHKDILDEKALNEIEQRKAKVDLELAE